MTESLRKMEKDLRLKLLGPNMCQRVLTQPERTMNGSRDEAFTSEVKLFSLLWLLLKTHQPVGSEQTAACCINQSAEA